MSSNNNTESGPLVPNGLAPIVGWMNGSPTKGAPLYSSPIASSKGSSGIGPDSPKYSSDEGSLAYSVTASSVGDEPLSCVAKDGDDDEETRDNNNSRDDKGTAHESLLNGSLKSGLQKRKSTSRSTVVTDNPTYEVKFGGDVILGDGDSIVSSSRSSLTTIEEDERPTVPDGGWGWVVVFSSLVISMIADGISFSFGLLYIEFLDFFGESKSKTSWIGSLFMAVPLLSGPVMSALVDRYGCRNMTILGGLISGTGFVMAAFCNTIEMMFLTFGVVAGVGLGMCYVTAVVSIAYWFDKKRTLATGLGACGTGIGTFVYAPMTQYFIATYGWRGTTLLLAGTFLNMCVCGALMRDPEWWTLEQEKQASLAGNKSIRAASSCGSISGRSGADAESNFPGVEEIRKMLKSGETPEYILTTLVTSAGQAEKIATGAEEDDLKEEKKSSSVVNLPTFIRQSEKVPLEVLEALSANKKIYNVILENYPSLLLCRSFSENKLNKVPPDTVVPATRVPVTMSMRLKQSKTKRATYDDNIKQSLASPIESVVPLLPTPIQDTKIEIVPKKPFFKSGRTDNPIPWKKQDSVWKRQFSTNQHYLKNIRVHRNSVMYRGAILNIHKYRLRASSCPDIYRNSMTTIARENDEKWYEDALELLKGMFDFSMFLELHFLFLSLATILLFTWFIVPYFYLAEHMTRFAYTEDEAAFMLSIIGVTNTIGMVGLGWAGDQPWMNVTKTYSWCLFACGVATAIFPIITHSYWMMAVCSAFFGLFFASNFSFTPTILVQLIPLERFTTAYGLILLCQGIGNLLGPPLAGWIFDVTQSWDLSFYMAGFFIFIAGALLALMPITTNRRIWGKGPLTKDIERDNVSFA